MSADEQTQGPPAVRDIDAPESAQRDAWSFK